MEDSVPLNWIFISNRFLCSHLCSDVKVQMIGALGLNRQLLRSNPASHMPSALTRALGIRAKGDPRA